MPFLDVNALLTPNLGHQTSLYLRKSGFRLLLTMETVDYYWDWDCCWNFLRIRFMYSLFANASLCLFWPGSDLWRLFDSVWPLQGSFCRLFFYGFVGFELLYGWFLVISKLLELSLSSWSSNPSINRIFLLVLANRLNLVWFRSFKLATGQKDGTYLTLCEKE